LSRKGRGEGWPGGGWGHGGQLGPGRGCGVETSVKQGEGPRTMGGLAATQKKKKGKVIGAGSQLDKTSNESEKKKL